MINNGKTNCPFEDEIVSYIYDEMFGAERLKFETHLAGCSICTDEFAAISDARFSMFEWQKEEFSNLPTPEIVIPYERKRNFVEETEPIGLFAGLRGWISILKLPVAAAAGLTLVLGLIFIISRSNLPEQPIAANVSSRPADLPAVPSIQPVIQASDAPKATVARPENRDIRPVKVVVRRQGVNEKQIYARNQPNQKPHPAVSTAPVLSTAYEADDDNSLRLADLFADIDS